jgi:hypothetical protein
MGHHLDSEAWKVFDRLDADFASDARNVGFGMVHSVPTLHRTLADPSLLCRTTYHHIFV